jgi:hypothetical protein
MDEDVIERIIEELREQYEEDSEVFTQWEQEFIESIDERNCWDHLSPSQLDKLFQIYEERM